MQIKIIDILFNDQVCNLVYMQDITPFVKNINNERTKEDIDVGAEQGPI